MLNLISIILITLLVSACSGVSKVQQNNDELNTNSIFSIAEVYDNNQHRRVADEFCMTRNRTETAQIIKIQNAFRGDRAVVQTTFFCASQEKMQQMAAEAESAKIKIRQAEEKKQKDEAERKAKFDAEEKVRKIELAKKLEPIAKQIGDKRNRDMSSTCKVPTALSSSIREYASNRYRVHPSSINLQRVIFEPIDMNTNSWQFNNLIREVNGEIKMETFKQQPKCTLVLYHQKGVSQCEVEGNYFRCD